MTEDDKIHGDVHRGLVEGLLRINVLEAVAGTRCLYGEKYHTIVARASEDTCRGTFCAHGDPAQNSSNRAADTLREPQAIHVATARATPSKPL